MKMFLLLTLTLVASVSLADPIATELIAAAPTLNLLEIGQKGAKFYEGKVLKITFGWQQNGLLYASNGKQKGGVRVVIPEAGALWLSRLPAAETRSSTQSVYVLVTPGINGNERFEAIGRTITNGQPAW